MDKRTFFRFSLYFSAVYFFSLNGLGALPNLSVTFLLKEKIHLTPSQAAYFQAVAAISWVIKPLWGYISDSFPLFGYRRKSYLILMSLLVSAAWLGLAMMSSYSVPALLILVTLAYSAYAFQDVVTDGLVVEVGQPENLTGRFQSIQWSAVYFAMMMTSLSGGVLADHARSGKLAFQTIFAIAGIIPMIVFVLTFFLIQEKPRRVSEPPKIDWSSIFKNKKVWLLAAFLFLWTFSPSLNTPFLYYAVDKLKFDGTFFGILQAVAAGTAFVTSMIFAKWIDRIPVRKFMVTVVLIGVVFILSNLVYFVPAVIQNPSGARMIALVTRVPFALFDALVILTLMNLAARISPQFAGGSIFALLMSFYNLGQVGSDILGGLLFGLVGLKWLIVISAAFSLLTLFVLPFLAIPEPLTGLEQKIRAFLGREAA